jgi:hypothetical protein
MPRHYAEAKLLSILEALPNHLKPSIDAASRPKPGFRAQAGQCSRPFRATSNPMPLSASGISATLCQELSIFIPPIHRLMFDEGCLRFGHSHREGQLQVSLQSMNPMVQARWSFTAIFIMEIMMEIMESTIRVLLPVPRGLARFIWRKVSAVGPDI